MTTTDQPILTLTNPTPNERIHLVKGTYSSWGGKLSLESYIARETDLTIPINRNGGITCWLLTTAASEPDSRPLLTSCETLRKRALVKGKDGEVRDAFAQGVASVFTPEEQRGKGYAGRMMGLLAQTLAARANEEDPEAAEGPRPALFSVLFSDVGKEFYSKKGWKAFPSTHFSFPVTATQEYPLPDGIEYITSLDEIAQLTATDETLLRKRLSEQPTDPSRVTVAIIPDNDHMLWHMSRENIASQAVYPSEPTPQVHGAKVAVGDGATRVWALWARKLRGAETEKNTLYFLRLVVEAPEKVSDTELGEALGKIVTAARREAKLTSCAKVQMWSPEARVKKVVEAEKNLDAEFVVRDMESILSLAWFGEESVDDVDWIVPEQYTWC
ncbi:N-acetyltransferase-like protein [Sarocladium implicatum]|nr:N-acetyltransferase-like protein [Sarocladium implicatum]